MKPETAPVQQPTWFKSSYSGGNETECVEAAFLAPGTAIRDSKRPAGPRLRFSGSSWEAFVAAVQEDRMPPA
ncbi:DUF397 domain-containing protein [Streptomyces melanogenes]|uniref:DUF397 domain-containing protein n=1 Tax=Streptomyces melanogenes TaxID=67326 RepID=A0ABZ1XIZ2_9ACTN|nr:DUF397 domain-containing protein [Streptomyces melanogenes]